MLMIWLMKMIMMEIINNFKKPSIFKEKNLRVLKEQSVSKDLSDKCSLMNLRHSTDNILFLLVNRIQESGITFTAGYSEGLGRGGLPRVL